MMSPTPPTCIFGDMCDLLDERFKASVLSSASSMDFADLRRVIVENCNKALRPDAWCYVHKRRCRAQPASIHAAGWSTNELVRMN